MFKFLVVASFVALAITQSLAATQSYVTAAESFTGTSSCAPGTNNANIYAASVTFSDASTSTSFTTGVCNSTLGGTASVSYNYTNGLLQKLTYTTANCTGTATATNLTTSCANNTAANGFPSSAQTVAIPYTAGQFPSLPGYLAVLLYNSLPYSGTFAAAGVCLRIPQTPYTKWNSTKYTCNGANSMATPSYYSDNACATPYVAPPTAPVPPVAPVPIPPPVPSPYSYLYFCSNSGPPVAAPVAAPSGGSTPSAPGSTPPSGSTPGSPKAPSAAATSILSAAAAAVAGVALLF